MLNNSGYQTINEFKQVLNVFYTGTLIYLTVGRTPFVTFARRYNEKTDGNYGANNIFHS